MGRFSKRPIKFSEGRRALRGHRAGRAPAHLGGISATLAGPTTLSRPFSGAEVVMRKRAGPGLRPGVPFGEACGRRLERAAEELQVTVAERERYLAMFNIRLYRRKISLI